MSKEEFRLSYGEDASEYVKHPVLLKHLELLRTLMEDRVMCVFHSKNDGFWMEECCDNYYCHTLTRDECLELSEMFKEIAENMKENKNAAQVVLDLDKIYPERATYVESMEEYLERLKSETGEK